MAFDRSKILSDTSQLPSKMTKVTGNISKGASSVANMTDKMKNLTEELNPKNPVSKIVFGGVQKTTEVLNKGMHGISSAAGNLESFSESVSSKIEPVSQFAGKLNEAIKDLENCQAVFGTSSLLVNAIVDSASGHFHPRNDEKLFSQFDNQWDSWAKCVNNIFDELSGGQQKNVLEALAKDNFGNNVFALGSAVKNESAGIFGGIADFEDALHSFRGSYRNPAEAVNKIETGVKGIIRATERVANSVNNMIKTYQKGIGVTESGNPVLSYLGSLHDTKAITVLNRTLSVGVGASTLITDASALGQALTSKNPLAIYNAGKTAYDDVRNLVKNLKTGESALGKVTFRPQSTNTESLKPDNSTGTTPQQENNDDSEDSGKTDSYVCSKAKIKCTFGDKISTLTVFPDRTIWLTGEPQANISDHISMQNIAPFGKCHTTTYPATGSATASNHGHLTPMPCVPNTPFPWMNGKNDVLLKGQPALLKSSSCRCVWGGTITITFDGQK